MPKAARVLKHRGVHSQQKAATPTIETPTEDGDEDEKRERELGTISASEEQSALSRGQRKRQAKRDQYLKREKMVLNSLKLKRVEEQKKRIDGLDDIREALLATVSIANGHDDNETELPRDNLLVNSRSRKRLLQQETAQMCLVVQHPRFKADPFSTLKEHLTNTMVNHVKLQQKEAIQHARDKIAKHAEKIALKKESGAKRKRKRCKATRSKSR